MKRILVTDGHSRATLQIVRSLGRAGHEIHVSEKFKLNPSFFSKYTKKHLIYPNPSFENEFIEILQKYCIANEIDIIIPVVDECLLAIAKNRSKFQNIIIPFAEIEKLDTFRDKLQTIRLCENLNLPHPKTFFSRRPKFKEISEKLGFPIIIKPRISSGSRGIELVKDFKSFETKYNKVRKLYGHPLIQEFIPNGGACGAEFLYDKNGAVAYFSHFRIREYPESGGPSTYRKPIYSNVLRKLSEKLLDKIKWYGPAMVEFRIDSVTGIPKIMEVNGRYWGSLACSIASGVDFPKLHVAMAQEEKVKSGDFDLNIRSRWETGDILWLISKRKDMFKYIPSFLRGISSDKFDFLQRDDPFPFVMSIAEAASFLFSSKGRKHSLDRGWQYKKT